MNKVFLYPTMKCNLRCAFCYSNSPLKQEKNFEELDITEYASIIKQLYEYGIRTYDISGGEPLLRRDFFEICKIIKYKESELLITTNGTRVKERINEIIPAMQFIDRIYISLDSTNPDIHNSIRGRNNAFEMAVNGIRALCALDSSKVAVNTVLNLKNSNELLDIVSFCISEQISELAVLLPRDVCVNDLNNYLLSHQEYRTILEELVLLLRKNNSCKHSFKVKVMLPAYLFDIISFLDQKYSFLKYDNPRLILEIDPYRGCRAYNDFIAITVNGDVIGCPFMTNYSCFSIGNIRNENLSEILKCCPDYHRSIKLRGNLLRQKEPCSQCDISPLCQGGCPAVSYKYFKETSAPDPTCPKVESRV